MSEDEEFLDTWIARHASRSPDALALVARDATWTWRQLLEEVEGATGRLATLELAPGMCVALDFPNGLAFLAAMAACAGLGLVAAPLHRRWSARTRAHALHTLGAAALWSEDRLDVLDAPRLTPMCRGAHPLLVLFTSGTSGEPRAVPLMPAQISATMRQFTHDLALSPAHVLAAIAPWYHVAGLNTMTLPLLRLGATIVCFDAFDVEALADAMPRHGINATFMVPTMWQALRQSDHFERGTFDRFELALTGGARAPLPLLRAWLDRGVPMRIGYGMTEAAPMVTLASPAHWMHDALNVGVPNAEVSVRLCEEGVLAVRGPNVSHAYLDARTPSGLDTTRFTSDGEFMTSDLGEHGEGDTWRILGRADDVIITGGEKVSPGEVEAAIEALDGMPQCVVLGLPDDYWGEVVVAVCLESDLKSMSCDVLFLRNALDGSLDRYKMPREVVAVERWPPGATGKIDREALRATLRRRQDVSAGERGS